jgi:two-component system, NarL family, invasion response regulator UvrY
MKILVVDDHSVVREGLINILKKNNLADFIEEAKDGSEALEKIVSDGFDLVILDISMPVLSGIEILKKLKSLKIKINILILSIYNQSQYAVQVLRLGASGYLSKNSTSDELAQAIRKISAGGKYISSDVIGMLISDVQIDMPFHKRLSDREFQILCLLAKGNTLVEIGKKLFISDKTVSTYRTRLLKKMELKSNSEITLYAYKNNLID